MPWQIDPVHSTIEFAVKHMMITTVKGRFKEFQGSIDADDAAPSKAVVEVTISAASIDTHEGTRDNHLRSADFLDVEKFPAITVKSRQVQPQGKDRFQVTGDLTIHGITKPVQLEVTATGEGKDPQGNRRRGFEARAEISRKDYGLNWNVALETGGVLVGESVKINLEVSAVQKAPVASTSA